MRRSNNFNNTDVHANQLALIQPSCVNGVNTTSSLFPELPVRTVSFPANLATLVICCPLFVLNLNSTVGQSLHISPLIKERKEWFNILGNMLLCFLTDASLRICTMNSKLKLSIVSFA